MTLYDQLTINRRAENAVKAQEKVGALGASSKTNPEITSVNRRAENAARLRDNQKDVASGLKIQGEPTGQTGQGGRPLGDTTYRDGGRLQDTRPSATNTSSSDASKSGGGPSLSQGLNAASSVLKTLDMLTGGQDKIIPGSGYSRQQGYNPDMYIGQGMGY